MRKSKILVFSLKSNICALPTMLSHGFNCAVSNSLDITFLQNVTSFKQLTIDHVKKKTLSKDLTD